MTHSPEQIPGWAKERAVELFNEAIAGSPHRYTPWRVTAHGDHPTVIAFARYIAAHEEPPVDPVKAATADAFRAIWDDNEYATCEAWSERMHAELEKRGLKIVEAEQ